MRIMGSQANFVVLTDPQTAAGAKGRKQDAGREGSPDERDLARERSSGLRPAGPRLGWGLDLATGTAEPRARGILTGAGVASNAAYYGHAGRGNDGKCTWPPHPIRAKRREAPRSCPGRRRRRPSQDQGPPRTWHVCVCIITQGARYAWLGVPARDEQVNTTREAHTYM